MNSLLSPISLISYLGTQIVYTSQRKRKKAYESSQKRDTNNASCGVSFFLFFTFSFGVLHFTPGDSELEIAVNIINDDIPEEQEYFHVSLKNPTGGAEIGFGGQVTVFVPTNDDAHGVIGFAQVSR